MSGTSYHTPDSNSTPEVFPTEFTTGFRRFTCYPINGTWYVRDHSVKGSFAQVFYGPAALDYFMHKLHECGARVERNWRATMWMYVFANVLKPMPRLQAEHGRRPQQSLIDVAFCESCGENIKAGEMCGTCVRQSALDLQSVVTAAPKKRFNAPTPGLPQAARTQRARNARTGREIHTTSQKADAELMARYPHARTPSEAAQLAMHDYLASKRIAASALKAAGAR